MDCQLHFMKMNKALAGKDLAPMKPAYHDPSPCQNTPQPPSNIDIQMIGAYPFSTFICWELCEVYTTSLHEIECELED